MRLACGALVFSAECGLAPAAGAAPARVGGRPSDLAPALTADMLQAPSMQSLLPAAPDPALFSLLVARIPPNSADAPAVAALVSLLGAPPETAAAHMNKLARHEEKAGTESPDAKLLSLLKVSVDHYAWDSKARGLFERMPALRTLMGLGNRQSPAPSGSDSAEFELQTTRTLPWDGSSDQTGTAPTRAAVAIDGKAAYVASGSDAAIYLLNPLDLSQRFRVKTDLASTHYPPISDVAAAKMPPDPSLRGTSALLLVAQGQDIRAFPAGRKLGNTTPSRRILQATSDIFSIAAQGPLLFAGLVGKIEQWYASRGSNIHMGNYTTHDIKGPIQAVAASGKMLYAASGKSILALDRSTGQIINSKSSVPVASMLVHPDDGTLLVVLVNGEVHRMEGNSLRHQGPLIIDGRPAAGIRTIAHGRNRWVIVRDNELSTAAVIAKPAQVRTRRPRPPEKKPDNPGAPSSAKTAPPAGEEAPPPSPEATPPGTKTDAGIAPAPDATSSGSSGLADGIRREPKKKTEGKNRGFRRPASAPPWSRTDQAYFRTVVRKTKNDDPPPSPAITEAADPEPATDAGSGKKTTARLPTDLTYVHIENVLAKAGFDMVRSNGGAHRRWQKKASSRTLSVTVPAHAGEIIGPPLLKSILRQADMTVPELLRYLGRR